MTLLANLLILYGSKNCIRGLTMQIKIKDVKIGKRIRKDIGSLDNLKKSIKRHGLINPISVTAKGELISGYRRLTAAREMGWKEIDAKIVNPKDDIEQLEMEIEENIVRKEFSQQELLDGLKRKKSLVSPNIFVRFWRWLKRLFAAK